MPAADPPIATLLATTTRPARPGESASSRHMPAIGQIVARMPAESMLKLLVPESRMGRTLVDLFDGLEVAYQVHRLAGRAWGLERLEIIAIEADETAEVTCRRAVNDFWGWDVETRWERVRRHDRFPTAWTCTFARDLLSTRRETFDVILGPPESSPFAPVDPTPLRIPRCDREAARYFLTRFTGQLEFGPGQWEAVSRVLAGDSALLLGSEIDAQPVCQMLEKLLPGVLLRVEATRRTERDPDLESLGGPAARSLELPVWRLQDQRYLQRLRRVLRAVPGGLSLVVASGAERTSAWCPDFEPAWTRLPLALQEIATRPGIPVLALADSTDGRVVADVAGAFRCPAANPEVAVSVSTPVLAFPAELMASEPDADSLAPVRREFPGWRLEAELARRELGPMREAIESGGFATVPVRRLVSPDGDAGRADRFRGFLSRLHALGFIAGFGENAAEFVVKHPIVPGWSVGAYLAPIAGRALTRPQARAPARTPASESALERALEPNDFGSLAPVDLCERLVQHVLGRNEVEARRTALFFERFVCPHLHEAGPIAVPKRPRPDEEIEYLLEPLLYRLAKLEVVREYFLSLEAGEPRNAVRVGTEDDPARAGLKPMDGEWKVAFRKPDVAVMNEILYLKSRSVQLRSAGVPPAPRAIASGSRRDAGAPVPSGGPSLMMWVTDALEHWIRLDYDAILPDRVAGIRGRSERPAHPTPSRAIPASEPATAPGSEPDTAPAFVPDSAPVSVPDPGAPDPPDGESLLEAAFSPDPARELAHFDPAPIVAHFAARLQLGVLRDRAADQARSNPDDLAAHVLLWLAHWELGAAREASRALARALDGVVPAGSTTDTEALLALCPPELRAIELGMRREALSELLGPRRVRRLLHDTYATAGREHDADTELLAELQPLSAAWRTAPADLEPLAPLLSKLESGYGPLDACAKNAESPK